MAKTAVKTSAASGSRRAVKFVYDFQEGGTEMRALLGGKGAGVAEMTRAGLPVPPGFTITTEACLAFLKAKGSFPGGMLEEVRGPLSRCRG